jgi:Na+/H+ antiporter 1
VWANSPWSSSYRDLWDTQLAMRAGGSELALDFRHWVNHGLMAFFFFLLPFFFVTGLEIRREFDMGELRERRRLATPLGRGRAPEVIARLRARARDNRITLVTATRDLERSGARVLLDVFAETDWHLAITRAHRSYGSGVPPSSSLIQHRP